MSSDVRVIRNVLLPHFGEHVTSVACALAKKGRQTLAQVARVSGHTVPIARLALLVLIQHGLAVYFAQVEGSREVLYYTLDVQRVLWRQRFPRYIKAARDLYQDEGKLIVSLLLLHGRLSLAKLLALTDRRQYQTESVRETFIQMVHDRYLKGSAATDSVSDLDVRLKRHKEDLDKLGVMPTPKELRSLALKREREAQEELDNAVVIGMKRKPGLANSTSAADYSNKAYKAFDLDPDVYFVVHYEKFHRTFQLDMLVQVAQERINLVAGKVLRCAIQLLTTAAPTAGSAASDSNEGAGLLAARPTTATTVTPSQIHHNLQISEANLAMEYPRDFTPGAVQKVNDYLDLLEASELLVKDSNRNAFALPSQSQIATVLQVRHAQHYAYKRHGKWGMRIFRALLLRGKLEEKQLATLTMLPVSSARRAMYEMHHQGLIELQLVHKTADRAPMRTFYIFYIDMPNMVRSFRLGLRQALCNAAERLVATEAVARGGAGAAAAAAAARRQRLLAKRAAEADGGEEGDDVDKDMVDAETLMQKNEKAQRMLKVALLRLDKDMLIYE
ncbi:RNA polymerase III subunit C82 [Blastocladiella emersonii ATCC 22665]|nr:RNA polymerase III subunit C82 [Blastocladiella emersonii ATCC 22665]